MAGYQSDSEDEITGINVTPLVDVVLVLLIIFMVTANFIVKESFEVDLPKAANAGESVQGLLSVVLDREGKLFLDGAEVSEADLTTRVKNAVLQDAETRAMISADRANNYGRVMQVIDLVKGQGVAKFALNIDRLPTAAPTQP